MTISSLNLTAVSSSGITSHQASCTLKSFMVLGQQGPMKLLTSKALGRFVDGASYMISVSQAPQMIENWLQI